MDRITQFKDTYTNILNTTSKITGIVDTTYTWDKNGNRLVSTGNNSSQVNTNPKVLTTNQQTLSYTAGKANRLQTNKTYNTNNSAVILNKTDSISIDAVGNILNDGLRTYTYDGLNRLSSVQNVGNTILTKYTYDIQNRRVSKTNNSINTNYIYADTIAGLDNTQLLGEYNVNTPTDKTEYVYLGNLPIALYKNNSILTIHADHLNTPRQLSDNTKKVVWNLPYTAFGENIPKSINNTVFNLRYPGQYYDVESKLHYNINRYYDPITGRYTQSDPIGLSGGINTYTYTGGNAVGRVDRNGLVVSVCTSPAFGIKGISHYWIKTATKSAGMAGDENRAGGLGSIIVDHSFRDTEKDSSCTERHDIDESCVNTYIDVTLDQEFGYWFPPFNYCKTYVGFVITMCINKK